MSPCQAGLGPSKITIGWFPGMSTGYLAKRTNIKYVSFGMKMLLYQKSPCITWNIPGLLTSHILPDNYHSLDKEADTVQSTCTYLEDDSNYFIRSLNTQYLLFSRYKILIKRTCLPGRVSWPTRKIFVFLDKQQSHIITKATNVNYMIL